MIYKLKKLVMPFQPQLCKVYIFPNLNFQTMISSHPTRTRRSR